MPLQPNHILKNRYKILKLIKEGGFGAIYEALDININKKCAVKENLQKSSDSEKQFILEAQVLANLDHPNLPRVTDYFIVQGQGQYLVMDFVEGQDLEEILNDRGPIPPDQAIDWVLGAAAALSYLHSCKPPVVHRDVKPPNIIITPDNHIKLVDFGLVKVHTQTSKTAQGGKAYTPGFAPIEQYGSGGTNPATDVYALGATLYNLLTNVTPPEAVDRVQNNKTLIPPSRYNPMVSSALEQVVFKAMANTKTYRYQAAGGFIKALKQARRTPVPSNLGGMSGNSGGGIAPTHAGPPGYAPEPPTAITVQTKKLKGSYINILKWKPSTTPGVCYQVNRKYHVRPGNHTDGEVRGTVWPPTFEDLDPQIGVRTYYGVYANANGQFSVCAAEKDCFRVADVTNLIARREPGGQVHLSWTLPPNVYKVIIRRDRLSPPSSQQGGEEVMLPEGIKVDNSVEDYRAPKGKLFYSVFCSYRDGGVWLTSDGVSVPV